MSPWEFGRKEARPTETTWIAEDVELAPDWVQDEIVRGPEELKEWLAGQGLPQGSGEIAQEIKVRRRFRQPKAEQ